MQTTWAFGDIILFVICLLIAMTVHEFMHAWVSLKLGDTTALEQGRISLNPFRHIDPMLTIALPVITYILFHAPILAAKPVPFTPWRLKYHEKGAALMAFAGPFSNLVLAAAAAVALRGFANTGSGLTSFLSTFVVLNIGLFVFNLVPIPPLDGSRVLYAFMPASVRNLMDQIEPYGFFVIFALVLVGGFGGLLSAVQQFFLRLLLG